MAVTAALAVSASTAALAESPAGVESNTDNNSSEPSTTEQQEQAASEPSTEIESFTPSETEEKEDGSAETTGLVNVDEEGGTVTNDGELTVTETPDETTTEVVDTKTTTETTGNTTTTTTETTTETTETSETTIKGEVSDSETTTPAKEEKDKLPDGVGAGKDGNLTADDEKYTVTEDEKQTDEKGNTVHTYEVASNSAEKKPLTGDELGKILGADLKENEDGTYTYTKEDGSVVTVAVQEDNSTEKTTTTWTIKVTEQTKTETGKADVSGDQPVTDITADKNEAGELLSTSSVKDSLQEAEAFADQGGTVDRDTEGRITGFTKDTKTYSFQYEEISHSDVDIGNESNAYIYEHLLSDEEKEEYSLKDGKILDKDNHEVTFTTIGQKTVKITMTVTDAQGSKSDEKLHGGAEGETIEDADKAAKAEAERLAKLNAIDELLTKQEITVKEGTEPTNTEGNTWTVEATDGKTYTLTVTPSEGGPTQSETAWSANIENSCDGKTYTYTGTAYVTGETVVWEETEGSQTSFIKDDGTVNATIGQKFREDSDEIVESVTTTEGGVTKVVTKTENTTSAADGTTTTVVTKTYTFTSDNVTEEDKNILLGNLPGAEVTDVTKIKKVTWTVGVETKTREVKSNAVEISSGASLTYDENTKKYTYKKDKNDQGIVLTRDENKGVYTAEDGTTYEITEGEMDDADIINAIKTQYGLKDEAVTLTKGENGGTATWTVTNQTDGSTSVVTVQYTAPKNIDAFEVSTSTVTDTDQNNLIQKITQAVQEAEAEGQEVYTADNKKIWTEKGEDGNIKLYGFNANNEKTEVTTTNIDKVIGSLAVSFGKMSEDEIKAYLKDLKEKAEKDKDEFSFLNHFDLDSASTLTKEDGTEVECVVLPDFDVKYSESTDNIVAGNGQSIDNISREISWDNTGYGQGHYEYQHEMGRGQQQNSLPNKSQYFVVTGYVAYDFDETTYKSEAAAEKALILLKKQDSEAYANASVADKGGEYVIYKNKATLEAYGYLSNSNSNCKQTGNGGYDLMLQNLTLVDNVVSSTGSTTVYGVTLTKKKAAGTGSSLTANNKTTVTTADTTGEGGSELTGKYEITQTKTENDLKDQNSEWLYTGTGTSSYDTYKTWEETKTTGTATGTKYAGELSYTYQVPDTPMVEVLSKTVEKVRDVDAVLDVTTVSTKTETEKDTTIIKTPDDGGSDVVIIPPIVIVPQTPAAPEAVVEAAEEDPEAPVEAVAEAPAEAPQEKLPQTGQSWALSGLLSALGALLISAGIVSRKGKHEA